MIREREEQKSIAIEFDFEVAKRSLCKSSVKKSELGINYTADSKTKTNKNCKFLIERKLLNFKRERLRMKL